MFETTKTIMFILAKLNNMPQVENNTITVQETNS